jgi:hypothetical protein
MLSEIVASLFAFALRPERPAFIDEEMLMFGPLSVRDRLAAILHAAGLRSS